MGSGGTDTVSQPADSQMRHSLLTEILTCHSQKVLGPTGAEGLKLFYFCLMSDTFCLMKSDKELDL